MSAAATRNDLLLPRPPGGMVQGAALAVLAHAVLLLALTAVVQWRTSTSEPVSAELWSAVPQIAAPRPAEVAPPPPPPPPPAQPRVAEPPKPAVEPDAQIAIARQKAERERVERERAERALHERAEREKAERAKAERDRREREAEAKARELAERQTRAAEEKRLAEQRQKQIERLMSQAGTATSSTGTAARDAGPSRAYAGRLVAAIKPNIVFTDTLSGNPAAEVEVRAGPSGAILARRIVRSSGHKDWDEAVLRAIDRTSTLPRDTDGRVPPTIIVEFKPNE